ncbi:hypothetical protein BH24CHL5_BH24CHL5_02830 [soil metagenome]
MAPDGRPRLVPLAYALAARSSPAGRPLIYSALDEKPKSVDDPRRLARVRDVLARPDVTVLVDHWSEDWSELAWLRLEGRAGLLEPLGPTAAEHAGGVELLRARYPQYASQRLESRPMLRIEVERALSWGLSR